MSSPISLVVDIGGNEIAKPVPVTRWQLLRAALGGTIVIMLAITE